MKLYKELADWWPLMSPHTEYEEEAGLYKTSSAHSKSGGVRVWRRQ